MTVIFITPKSLLKPLGMNWKENLQIRVFLVAETANAAENQPDCHGGSLCLVPLATGSFGERLGGAHMSVDVAPELPKLH